MTVLTGGETLGNFPEKESRSQTQEDPMAELTHRVETSTETLQTVSESEVRNDQEVEMHMRTMDSKLQQKLCHLQRNDERRTGSYSSQFMPAECSTQCPISPQKNELSPRPKRVDAPPWNSQVLPSYSEPYRSLREQVDESLRIAMAERDSVVNKLELPIFDGAYPYGWIIQVERFFRIGRYSEEERMNLIFLCLSGEALKWYWEAVKEPFSNWPQFMSRLLLRFGKAKSKSPTQTLFALKQTSSVDKEEESEFRDVTYKEGVSVSGLQPELQERVVAHALENAKSLSSEVRAGAEKLKTVEDQCTLLESSKETLKLDADGLMYKLAAKDEEPPHKQNELEKFQALIQDEQPQLLETEANHISLQSLHSQFREEKKVLASELQNRIDMLRDVDTRNQKLEGDISSIKEENQKKKNISAICEVLIENKVQELTKGTHDFISLKLDKKMQLKEEGWRTRKPNKYPKNWEFKHKLKEERKRMKLQIRVLEARKLPAMDLSGYNDAYVRLQLEKQKSQIKVVKQFPTYQLEDKLNFGMGEKRRDKKRIELLCGMMMHKAYRLSYIKEL